MSKLYLTLIFFLITASCGRKLEFPLFKDSSPVSQVVFAPEDNKQINPREYIVAFKQSENGISNFNNYSFKIARTLQNKSLFRNFAEKGDVKDIEFISQVNITDPSSKSSNMFERFIELGLPAKSFNLDDQKALITLVKFKSPNEAKSQITKWQKENKIWFAEPNWNSTLSQSDADTYFSSLKTSYDGAVDSKYWLKNTRMDEALGLINNLSSAEKAELLANPPIIAVLDSGVDILHDSIKDQVYVNETNQDVLCAQDQYGCNTSVDFKKGYLGNGFVNPVLTSDFGESCDEANGYATCIHGTHVAGIAVGVPSGSSSDAYGACPFCKLMVLKVVNDSLGISDSSILRALQYVAAFTQGGQRVVRIVNSSFGKYQKSRSVALMVRLISEQDRGILVVGAASNEDSMSRSYPAALSDALAVSALNEEYEKATYSNSGTWVDIAAPGSNILSSVPNQDSKAQNGTSMAAPLVAGIAGLLAALEPSLTGAQLKSRLINTSNPLIYEVPYNKAYYYPILADSDKNAPLLGAGVVDAYGAITNTLTTTPSSVENNRVTAGCSVLSSFEKDEDSSIFRILAILSLLFLPVIVSLFFKHPKKIVP